MPILFIIIGAVISVAAGTGLSLWLMRIGRAQVLRRAEAEAAQLLADAKDEAEHLMDEAKLAAAEAEDEIWAKYDGEITATQERVQNSEDEYRRKRSQLDRSFNQDQREIQKQMQAIHESEKQMADRQARFEKRKQTNHELRLKLVQELQRVSGVDPEELKHQLASSFETEIQVEARKKATAYEEEVRQNSEEIAKRIIGIALSRFPRAACTERGVGVVEIPNDDVKKRMLGPDDRNILLLQELCGVELSINDHNSFSVASFDPVRREVTTRCLEKLLHERAPSEETVRRLYEKTKNDVSRKIESDGNRVAAELGCRDMNPEIKKMLGTLRYRYSFAQNQHFHVAEVGWLCGLLASELGSVDIASAKRAGLLHDVGKAMDHAIEGGHAVIGADFIHQHNEKDHIVHAVRAHHYEEQPSTDLAFLVIAADAMSGARPGARRSTVTVYNQKIEALTSIADGIRGVTKTLVLNAGREVRILVDGRKVNDEQSLRLCRDIADKIEEECQYPGQIKVVVIRETHAEAHAK